MDNQSIKPLTLAEAEALARLYLDARLTHADEKRLMKVLAQSPLSSPLLDETRALMGLELSLAYKHEAAEDKITEADGVSAETVTEAGDTGLRRRRTLRRRVVLWSASAAALLAAAVMVAPHLPGSVNDEEAECIAYVNGQRVSDKEATRIATQAYLESMQELQQMEAQRDARIRESQQILNHVN